MADACSWVYKILPYIEQNNLYNNWNFTTPIKTLMDPGRGGTGLAATPYAPANPAAPTWSEITSSGPVTDYAANAMLLGSGMNTSDQSGNSGGWNGAMGTWTRYKRTFSSITDGTSSTVMVGTKALATNVYNARGGGNFTMSNGSTRATADVPITAAGIWIGYDLMRAQSVDQVGWMAQGTADTGTTPFFDFIPGGKFKFSAETASWIHWTYTVVQDAPDLNAANEWGSPYPGGAPIGMADGSVRSVRYGIDHTIAGPMCTPTGGEVYSLD
jgi:hypothetical protein